MPDEPPTPPADIPPAVVDALDGVSPDRLREIARYAESVADHKEQEARPDGQSEPEPAAEAESDNGDIEEQPDDLPDDVPTRATITVKEINDNRYYYWQWREGDSVTSKYEGPVEGDG